MIISFVSQRKKAGKGHAADLLFEQDPTRFVHHQFALRLTGCGHFLLGYNGSQSKYDKHPVLGISPMEINHIIADALQKVNPEIAVQVEKEQIEKSLEDGCHVLTSDTRRQREFTWLDEMARKYGTKHHIVEVVPVRRIGTEDISIPDTWSNGIEPCGYEAWKDRLDRHVILNDYTEAYDKRVVELVHRLANSGA